MYIPPKFNDSTYEEILDFVKANSFGILVNQSQNELTATHIPLQLILDGEVVKLTGHISKGNPQWKGFAEDDTVLAIFQGADAYISSTWYDHENVPTWNYVAAHLYGKVRIMNDAELYQDLKQLMDIYEAKTKTYLKISDLSEKYVQQQMRGIVGFEIEVTKIQAAHKLSQNRNENSYNSIVENLGASENPTDNQVAKCMRDKRPF